MDEVVGVLYIKLCEDDPGEEFSVTLYHKKYKYLVVATMMTRVDFRVLCTCTLCVYVRSSFIL